MKLKNVEAVVNAWANCKPGRSGNVESEVLYGPTRVQSVTLYSYREPIARVLFDPDGVPHYVVTTAKFSVTTSRHTRLAVDASPAKLLHRVPGRPPLTYSEFAVNADVAEAARPPEPVSAEEREKFTKAVSEAFAKAGLDIAEGR